VAMYLRLKGRNQAATMTYQMVTRIGHQTEATRQWESRLTTSFEGRRRTTESSAVPRKTVSASLRACAASIGRGRLVPLRSKRKEPVSQFQDAQQGFQFYDAQEWKRSGSKSSWSTRLFPSTEHLHVPFLDMYFCCCWREVLHAGSFPKPLRQSSRISPVTGAWSTYGVLLRKCSTLPRRPAYWCCLCRYASIPGRLQRMLLTWTLVLKL
jgi:hypothetical protein